MPDILPIVLALCPELSTTTCRRLHRIILAMLSITQRVPGRITQLGISRWTDKGGSYRTVHRFFHTPIDPYGWLFFQRYADCKDDVFLLAGDESPVSKSGKQTYGVGWFFSSVLGKSIPALAFFSIAIVNAKTRQAYSLSTEQVIRTPEEKEQTKKRKELRKKRSQDPGPKRPRGRPKGSKNKNRAEVTLSPELDRILAQARKVVAWIGNNIGLAYFVLDGHFGNHFACSMVRQLGLHFRRYVCISTLPIRSMWSSSSGLIWKRSGLGT